MTLRRVLRTSVLVVALTGGCSGDGSDASTATTSTTASFTGDSDHVVPSCEFAAGDVVDATDANGECVGLYDCRDGRVLAVAGFPPEGPQGDLAGYLPDHGDPTETQTVWRAFEEALPTKANPDTGRNELTGDCPPLN